MIILGLETSFKYTFAGVWDSDRDYFIELQSFEEFSHTENINLIYEKIQIFDGNIDLIALSKGPGFFTALRCGFAFAKAFALVKKTPIVSVLTADALAFELKHVEKLAVVQKLRKNNLFVKTYNYGKEENQFKIIDYEKLKLDKIFKIYTFAGTAVFDFYFPKVVYKSIPSAISIAKKGFEIFKNNKKENPISLEPLYILPPEKLFKKWKRNKL